MRDFQGKTAFITGGAGGLGRAFAKALLAEGANVALADIDERALERAVDEIAAPKAASWGWPATPRIAARSNGRRRRRFALSGGCISCSPTRASAAATPGWRS